MKTSNQIKKHLIDQATNALVKPSMVATNPSEYENFLWQNLRLLLFIDKREEDFDIITKRLSKRGRYSVTGIVGALKRNHRSATSKDIAKIFESIYTKLDYIERKNK